MDKMKMRTPDLTDENIERLAALFPNVITETRDENGAVKKAVDFDLLKQALSKNLVEDDNERYRLDWPGKKASLLKANTPITKTLRPCREESVNFDTTENLYIEGDNFEVLKILQESYLGKIKIIYIDPPYNTGNDFIYRDDFAKSKEDYEEEIGVEDEEGGKLFRNTDSNGRFHSDWLSMMYERLVVARDLLKDDGVIFISIDDNEVHNLRKICDEIFGEENLMNTIIWKKTNSPKSQSSALGNQYESVLFYAKNISEVKIKQFLGAIDEEYKQSFAHDDNDGKGPYQTVAIVAAGAQRSAKRKSFKFHGVEDQWLYKIDTLEQWWKEDKIYTTTGGKYRLKKYLSETEGRLLSDIWIDNEIKPLQGGSSEYTGFITQKPISLIKRILKFCAEENSLVLDFFSGSATTAHAVMQLNSEDGGNRKFIMVQLPEKIDENSEAYKTGYKTIAEIGKDRISRAGKKIFEELKAKNQQLELDQEPVDASKLDIGFRVYKTDESNMKDVFYHPAKLDQKQLAFVESNIKEDRTPEDLLTQVILDLGLELSLPIETKKIGKNTVFIVQTNALVASFDNDIDFKIVDTIAGLRPFKVVFKDASFKDDKDRINVEERFKRLSPETKVTVI